MSKTITLIEGLANHLVKEMNGTAQYLNTIVGFRKNKLTAEDLDNFAKIAKRLGEHAAFLKEMLDEAEEV